MRKILIDLMKYLFAVVYMISAALWWAYTGFILMLFYNIIEFDLNNLYTGAPIGFGAFWCVILCHVFFFILCPMLVMWWNEQEGAKTALIIKKDKDDDAKIIAILVDIYNEPNATPLSRKLIKELWRFRMIRQRDIKRH